MNENIAPSVSKRLLLEFRNISKDPIDDIKVHFEEDTMTSILADIAGPIGTPYEHGIFKVKLIFGPDFPAAPPKGTMLTKIFHPNVSKVGEICVNTLKKDWNPEYGVKHVLFVIRCLLIEPNPESALNEEAGKLLLENYDDYAKRAAMYTKMHACSNNEPVAVEKKEIKNLPVPVASNSSLKPPVKHAAKKSITRL